MRDHKLGSDPQERLYKVWLQFPVYVRSAFSDPFREVEEHLDQMDVRDYIAGWTFEPVEGSARQVTLSDIPASDRDYIPFGPRSKFDRMPIRELADAGYFKKVRSNPGNPWGARPFKDYIEVIKEYILRDGKNGFTNRYISKRMAETGFTRDQVIHQMAVEEMRAENAS